MDEAVLKRTAPSSMEAEMSVVGSMLLDRDAITEATEVLDKEDFYYRQYGIMFEAIRELYNEDKPVDLVTVRDRLQRDGAPPEMQSADFLKDLLSAVPTSVNARAYAEIVHDKAILRRMIKSNEEIIEECYDGSKDTEEILNDTEKALFELIKSKGAKEYEPRDDGVIEGMQKIEEASQIKDHITGVPSGFSDLDYMTTGFQPSDFILVAARPSMGKTAFVLNILEYVAIKKERPCMIFSLEMSSNQLVNRLLSMDSGVDAQSIRSGKLSDSDWPRLIDSADRVGASNIIIDDTPGISVPELRSKCRKVKLERGLDLIIIDYLQLIRRKKKKNDNRQQEVSEISRSLKALAREMECPVIALSQLSRACELRADKRPMLSDLRESGAIEQDADVVMFLYRDEYYEPDSEHKGEAEVIIAKQRNGPIGTVTLYWQASTTRFVSKERVYN